jgi:hypothetical protein
MSEFLVVARVSAEGYYVVATAGSKELADERAMKLAQAFSKAGCLGAEVSVWDPSKAREADGEVKA